MRIFALFVVLLLALASLPSYASADCKARYAERVAADMKLDYKAFDQTPGQGFRLLSEAGCDKEAADLIVEYIRVNDSKESSLRWHVAQLRASQGDNAQAVRYARTTLMPEQQAAGMTFKWNDYVLATIAFLEADLQKLQLHRDRVAAARAESRGNETNLKLLDKLVAGFGKSYKEATSAR